MRFRADPRQLRGSIAALVTPFTDQGELDEPSLRRLVEWQLEQGSHGISVGGSTGEPSAQSVDERVRAIEIVAETVADRVPFLAGTGSARLDETLALTEAAERAGADAVLVVTPYYARPTQAGLVQWYSAVAAQCPDLPLIAYNVPVRTAVDLAPDTVERLFAEIDSFVGIKETTHDFAHFSRVLQRCGPDLLVWSGIELLCLPLLALGGVGFISAATNLAPAACAELFTAWQQGDLERARALHFGLHPLVDALFVETNPAPAKWVLHRGGVLDSPHVRAPLAPLGDTSQQRVLDLLTEGAALLSPPLAPAAAPLTT